MRTTKRSKFVALAVGLALVAAACGADKEITTTNAPETTAGEVTETTAGEVTETTATRIGPEPASCGTPVEAGSWGQIKARYR